MLVIEATASVLIGATFACIGDVRVNGLLANPSTGSFNTVCTPGSVSSSQTISATYSLDIDDAEAFSPGVFVNQPLIVVVQTTTDTAGAGSISVVVRMEKK